MHTLIKKLSRYLLLGACFFLPKESRIGIERWHRGREEFRKLKLADAVIISFGKSGRTWLRVMISRFYQVRHGIRENYLIGFDNFHRKNRAIPKLFFTHDNYLGDYTGNKTSKTDYYHSKVVLLVRNPLDVAVSQYFQWKFRMRRGKKALNEYPAHNSDISIFDFVLDEKAGLRKVIDYLNLWAAGAEKMDKLLIVRYEDMRADTAQVLETILDFIDAEPRREEVEAAVKFASVENMRRMEEQQAFWFSGSRMVAGDRNNPNSYKVRKAKVGGFRDYFDDEQIAAMESLLANRLDPVFGYSSTHPSLSKTATTV